MGSQRVRRDRAAFTFRCLAYFYVCLYDENLPVDMRARLCARVCVETDRMSPGLTLRDPWAQQTLMVREESCPLCSAHPRCPWG